jgi:hypothetical protein
VVNNRLTAVKETCKEKGNKKEGKGNEALKRRESQNCERLRGKRREKEEKIMH